MASTFPTTIDSFTDPESTDQLSNPSHSAQHSNTNDAIEKLEAKVGADSSEVEASLDYKVDHLVTANITDLTATKDELNILDGATVNKDELNILDGATVNKDELNILDGATVNKDELNQLDGVAVGGNTAGDIVTTDDTQTLTNKTLTNPAISTINGKVEINSGAENVVLELVSTDATTELNFQDNTATGRLQYSGVSDQFYFYSDLSIQGTLSKNSGSFLIDHPVEPTEKLLRYGFVESPRYDLIHRGTVKFNGQTKIRIDIDKEYGLTKGTFEKLTQDAVVTSVQAVNSFTRVKASKVTGNTFTIETEGVFTGEVNWVVIAERDDKWVHFTKECDKEGHLINEVDKDEPDGDELNDKIETVKDKKEVGETQQVVPMGNKKGYYGSPEAFGEKHPTRKIIKEMKGNKLSK